jgi:hypothetical protein
MSPTKFEIAHAEIGRRCEAARRAGNLAALQGCMAEVTALYRVYYGVPPAMA